jgi:hypothetical protein
MGERSGAGARCCCGCLRLGARGEIRSAVHGGGCEGVRGKRVRVRVVAEERHHELRCAMTASEEPIAGGSGRRDGVRVRRLSGRPGGGSRKGSGDVVRRL